MTLYEWFQFMTAGASLLTAVAVIVGLREVRAKVPALRAQAEEANASVLQTSLGELRQQRSEDRTALAEARAQGAETREALAEMKKDQHFKDIAQDELTRNQAVKLEALETTNIKLQRDLDTEREARKQDVNRLQTRVTDLENENKQLRSEKDQLLAENTEMKKTRTRKRATKGVVLKEENRESKAA